MCLRLTLLADRVLALVLCESLQRNVGVVRVAISRVSGPDSSMGDVLEEGGLIGRYRRSDDIVIGQVGESVRIRGGRNSRAEACQSKRT